MHLIIPKISLTTIYLSSKKRQRYRALSGKNYGNELATQVADKLTSDNDRGMFFSHRDYCGIGLFFNSGKFILSTVEDAYSAMVIAEFDDKAEFIHWLANENDRSMSLYGKQFNNQTITESRLKWYLEDDYSPVWNAYCMYQRAFRMNANIIQQLQAIALDDEFLLQKGVSQADISKPIEIRDLLFRKTERFIGYAGSADDLPFESVERLNNIDFYAYKATYTTLGVLLFELLFSDKRYLEIWVSHPQSQIQQFFIYLDRENRHGKHYGLQIEQKETYSSFEYFSQAVEKFPFAPWAQRDAVTDALPHFGLACSNDHDNYQKDAINKADQLILTLTVTGLVQLAELFLDMGRTENEVTEICLENPLYGFGGVNERSIEARFWLPDSLGFYTDDINALKF